jgi:hypothetical protein
MASVDQKLSMTEEQSQDQSCLFWQRNYESKIHNPVNVLGSNCSEDAFSSKGSKHDKRMKQKKEIFVLPMTLQKLKSQIQNCPKFESSRMCWI